MHRHDTEELRAYAASGRCIAEIADELGTSHDAARIALSRRGITATPERCQSIQTRAEAMKPGKAVDFLLWQFELLGGIYFQNRHPVDDLGAQLTHSERKLMICLHEHLGRCVGKKALHSATLLGSLREDTDPKIVDVHICKIRKKLPASVGKIVNHWGEGYALHLARQTPSK